jgi:hypothetical protein
MVQRAFKAHLDLKDQLEKRVFKDPQGTPVPMVKLALTVLPVKLALTVPPVKLALTAPLVLKVRLVFKDTLALTDLLVPMDPLALKDPLDLQGQLVTQERLVLTDLPDPQDQTVFQAQPESMVLPERRARLDPRVLQEVKVLKESRDTKVFPEALVRLVLKDPLEQKVQPVPRDPLDLQVTRVTMDTLV